MNLPTGAASIINSRLAGKRPADPVVVCVSGSVGDIANPQVYPTGPNDDWRFMKDLDAIVYTSPEAKYLPAILKALARYARSIDLWDGSKGATLIPVWNGAYRAEVQGFSVIDRESARFRRWAVIRWMPTENRRFLCA